MRDCCAAHQFAPSDNGECDSFSTYLAEVIQREDEKKAESKKIGFLLLSKRNADTALMMVSVAVCFSLVASSFYFFAIPESQRLARVHQEQVVSR